MFSATLFGQPFGKKIDISKATGGANNLSTADIDGDGDLDLLSASYYDSKHSWYPNLGNGQYGRQQIIGRGRGLAIHAADLDDDGDFDVIVSGDNHLVLYYENIGGGVFADAHYLGEGIIGCYSICTTDIDGDSDLDIVACSTTSRQLAWFENDGFGVSDEPHFIESGTFRFSFVHPVDLDADGDTDILATAYQDGRAMWFENLGSGLFEDQHLIQTGVNSAFSLFPGDIDLDGDVDLVSSGNQSAQIKWYENDGSANFSNVHDINNTGSIVSPQKVFVYDIDEDNDLDFISCFTTHVQLHLNSGSGEFTEEFLITDNVNYARDALLSDIDTDGDSDIVIASLLTDEISWVENDGFGLFGEQHIVSETAFNVNTSESGDLDGDGDSDVVIICEEEFNVYWYENMGSNDFSAKKIVSTEIDFSNDIALADLDADGDLDLLTLSHENDRLDWYPNNGSGIFGAQTTITDELTYATTMALGDLNNDGLIDIVCTSDEFGDLMILLNVGAGAFSTPISIASLGSEKEIQLHDYDFDGDLDIIYSTGEIRFVENLGNGLTWEFDYSVGSPQTIYDFDIADFDLDGDFDVAFVVEDTDQVGWIEIISPSDYLVHTIDIYADAARSIVAIDADQDGDLDLASSARFDGLVKYYENIDGNFSPPQQIDFSYRVQELKTADIDGNGFLDLVSVAPNSAEVNWYQNQYALGCDDPSACNYNLYATQNDGSCCYDICGCTSSTAINYNPDALCDDGTCAFTIRGMVFNDEDDDGLLGESEYGLPNQKIYCYPDSLIAYSNEQGEFMIEVGAHDNYTLEILPTSDFQSVTTPPVLNFSSEDLGWNESILFGLKKYNTTEEVSISVSAEMSHYECQQSTIQRIDLRNTGNETRDLAIQIVLDEMVTGIEALTQVDDLSGNTISHSIEDARPDSLYSLFVQFDVPDLSEEEMFLTTQAFVQGIDWQEESEANYELTLPVYCSAEAESKEVFPKGYLAEHYIAADTLLQYIIRFENTGIDTAHTVLISDTLSDYLDASTLVYAYGSHETFMTLDVNTGIVEFDIPNANLPSVVDEPANGSGFVSFYVLPESNLAPLTEINNMALIQLDGEDPQPSNITWSTIIDCEIMSLTLPLDTISLCLGETLLIEAEVYNIEEIIWNLDDELLSDSLALEHTFYLPDSGYFDITFSNPLCTNSHSIPYTASSTIDSEIIGIDGFCQGDSTVLYAMTDGAVHWFSNDLLIAETDSISLSQAGTYVLSASMDNCLSVPDSIVVQEIEYPESPTLFFIDGVLSTYQLPDLTYQWFLENTPIDGADAHLYTPLEDGDYSLLVSNAYGCSSWSDITVIYLSLSELLAERPSISPNPMTDYGVLTLGSDTEDKLIEIYNSEGRLLSRERIFSGVKNFPLDVKGFSNGSYILKLTTNYDTVDIPFVVE